MTSYDVVVIGAGPNGLAAALAFARSGLATLVVEAADTAGGGTRTRELAGARIDVCSAVHPLAVASPWLRALDLEADGLAWIQPPAALAHVIGDRVVTLERSIDATAAQLGDDGDAYRELIEPFVARHAELFATALGPLRVPRDTALLARFAAAALRSLHGLARSRFGSDDAPALLAGIAAHAMVPLDRLATAAFALILAIAGHAVGWPIARGGSQAIADAMVLQLRRLGGELVLGTRVAQLAD